MRSSVWESVSVCVAASGGDNSNAPTKQARCSTDGRKRRSAKHVPTSLHTASRCEGKGSSLIKCVPNQGCAVVMTYSFSIALTLSQGSTICTVKRVEVRRSHGGGIPLPGLTRNAIDVACTEKNNTITVYKLH